MESELNLGSSIPVPCVQEVAKEILDRIPPRYQRPDQDLPFTSSDEGKRQQVPVIDLLKLLSKDFVNVELEKLHFASKEWGFFQLINHGVSRSLVDGVKNGVEGLFNLPMEEKKKLWQRPGDLEGFGQACVVSEEQKLDWGDMFFMTTLPTHLTKPHIIPNLPLPFRDDIKAYSEEVRKLGLKILEFQVKALGMDPNDLRIFEGCWQAMRMNYYPPCPQPELAMGLTPHSDAGGLTILLQVNEMNGLQIRKDGNWVSIKPLPDAFVVNVGDVMEIMSNGVYRSIEHRATVNSKKERLSVATFISPNLEEEMGPASSLITPQTPPNFKRIAVADYFKALFNRKLDGKSLIDVLRIQN